MAWPSTAISSWEIGRASPPCHADHQRHQVEAGDHLRHRMLDLDARVHLDKVERVRGSVVEIFDRARAAIFNSLGQRDRALAHGVARGGRQREGRGLLPNLLAAALERAFPLEAMHRAGAVAQHLHLDMAGPADDLLEIDASIAKGRLRLLPGLGRKSREILGRLGDANAAPATAGAGLDHHRVSDALGEARGLGHVVDAPVRSGNDRHACRLGGLTGRHLVAHPPDRVRGGGPRRPVSHPRPRGQSAGLSARKP